MKEYSMSMYASGEALEADKKRDLEKAIENCEEIRFRFAVHMGECEDSGSQMHDMYKSKVESLEFAIELMQKELSK